jgi:UV excision repair protein RAD23
MSQGPEFERNVTSLIEMGFERDLCVRALQAAYGNPERAVDYLMSGNIPNINQAPRPAARTPSAPSQSQQAPSSGAPTTPTQPSSQPQAQGPTVEELAALASILSQGPSGVSQLSAPQIQMLHRIVTMHAAAIRLQASQGGAPTGAPLGGSGGQQLPPQFAALRSNPVFQQMRQLVRQNPQMLQPLLQQLAQSNPQLVQMIQSNPAAFLSLLESDGDDGEGGPQPGVIQVTQAEKEAIDRLVALGFDRSLAIQAFFACDKQEEVAANYLFEHGHDFDGEDDGGDDGSDQ